MPIQLITGLPGNGKTAYYVSQLLELEKSGSKRKIYIAGIEILKPLNLDIQFIDDIEVQNWQKFDDGSLIVVDEAQNIFPQRSASKTAPDYITKLSEHRHKGLDFVFITQDPRLLDAWARRLVAEHRHIKRIFGSSFQAVFIWDKASDNPNDKWERQACVKKVTRLPKHVYGVYKSAAVHTIKRSVPVAVYVFLAAFVLFPVLAYWVFNNVNLGDNSTSKTDNLPSINDSELSIKSNIPKTDTDIIESDHFRNLDFIDNDLIFLDAIIYGKYTTIKIAMINEYGETTFYLDDLKDEKGLQYSLISQNKLLLKQAGKRRILYRTIRSDEQTSFKQIINKANANPDNRLKLPF